MTDGLRHLDMALELGRQLGRGEKVRLTKECPRCEGHGELPEGGQFWEDDYSNQRGYATSESRGCDNYEVCPDCKGTGRIPA